MASAPASIQLDPKYDDYDFPTTAPEPQSGHPGHTTPEQDAQVVQLRTTLEQLGYKERLDTLTLLRFLRARKFNVEAAKIMFVDCEKWRKEFGTDDLVRTFEYTEKPQVFEYYPQYYHKTDKDGRPVYIEKLGKIDLNAMYKITTGERMLQNLVCEYEKLADPRLPACSRKAGKLLETCCTIMDLKGVGITNVPSVYGYVRQASAISQNYYPERLGKLYLINAPWGFSSVFSVVKGFLDPVTVSKIHVLGSGYQKELLAQVPAENLPVEFGGKCACQGGCALSDMGPWQEPEWTRTPKWATPKTGGDDATIQTEATGPQTSNGEPVAAGETATDATATQEAKATA
ncbi:phosphatidylinositol transporter, putative [Paecilomyces variotii No. 5]|uniref:Phosphatidylinositol transporter, putative n=1 Tax=Byssochlamys spectabilis (strain No. 5 / NBRC 109023) TaxID=1356009 RepID=V5FAB0_BYSSN|nr:phosphatidylinositol transporter, putative [Paecilomyces variotii No. 5]